MDEFKNLPKNKKILLTFVANCGIISHRQERTFDECSSITKKGGTSENGMDGIASKFTAEQEKRIRIRIHPELILNEGFRPA